jgi:hypothetical protein
MSVSTGWRLHNILNLAHAVLLLLNVRKPKRARNLATMTSTTPHPNRERYREGFIAKSIEEQTARLPSDTFLWLAVSSILGSLTLQFLGKSRLSLFVGQWVATFLLLGVYNKLVKQLGSDRTENEF